MRSSSVCPAANPRAVCVLMLILNSLELCATRERYSGRAFHPNMFARCAPGDLEFSACKLHFDRGIEASVSSADRDSRARSCAAGERFARAAPEDAQPDVSAIDDFHESHVHALRKTRVMFDRGTESIHRSAGNR